MSLLRHVPSSSSAACVPSESSQILTARAQGSSTRRRGLRRPTAGAGPDAAVSIPEQLFADALPAVDTVVRDLARRYHLSRDDQEEFKGAVLVRLLEDDYAILRKYEGRASLLTYLRIVITRFFLDQRVKAWGRWRPSAEAMRLGALAVDLERLLERQRLPLDEAIATLQSQQADVEEATLRDLAARLPNRVTGRRLVDDAELELLPDVGPASDHLVKAAELDEVATQAAAALRGAIATLPTRARLLLRLRFERGASIADIARILGEPQKPLYREFERLLRDLRQHLEAAGVSASAVAALLGQGTDRLEGTLADETPAKPGAPSVSKGERPGDSGTVAE